MTKTLRKDVQKKQDFVGKLIKSNTRHKMLCRVLLFILRKLENLGSNICFKRRVLTQKAKNGLFFQGSGRKKILAFRENIAYTQNTWWGFVGN